jgi:hypothetical protein
MAPSGAAPGETADHTFEMRHRVIDFLPGSVPRTAGALGLSAALFAWTGALPARAADPPAPPGYNVHLVRQSAPGRFWRGGAPQERTLAALAAAAKERGVAVTLVDLRRPAKPDDRSGKGGRLTPQREESRARELGLGYLAVSALDSSLPQRIEAMLRKGDVYLHCMYGVNRTGFAVARYATAQGVDVGREGLGVRDWRDGAAFEARRSRSHTSRP